MQKTSFFKRFMSGMTAKLIIILIVLTLITMVISSGVLKGAPISAMFTDGFMSSANLRQIFYSLVIQLMIMCGIAAILIGGNIDLSVAGQAALATMLFAYMCEKTTLPWGIIAVITLLIGAFFGLINAFLVLKLKFPSFIATIGMASVYRGLCNIITDGYNIQVARTSFNNVAKISFGVFPFTFVLAIVLIIVFQIILSKTNFGRSIYMTGGNPWAARLAGINIARVTLILFIINGVMAALGGLCWTSQMKLASPNAIISSAPDMKVISATLLGGIAFTGGAGSLGGPFVAILLLNVLDNMLTVIGVQSYWNTVAQGALLAVALILDYIGTERRKKAMLLNQN